MVFNSRGCPLHLYRGQPANFWPALLSQEFQTLTAACWLIAKRTFLELGGFDPVFRNGWEDVDFCLRARQKGYKIFYQAESVIYHHGRSTPGRKDYEKANFEYFQCKWRSAIVPDLDEFYQVRKPEPKLEPQSEPKPEPQPELVSALEPVPVTPLPEELSHIERRYAEVERLHVRHPLIAGLLRALIRFATSVAKQINKFSN